MESDIRTGAGVAIGVDVMMEDACIGEDGAGVDTPDLVSNFSAIAVGNDMDVNVVIWDDIGLDVVLRDDDVVVVDDDFLLFVVLLRGDVLGDAEFGTDNCLVVRRVVDDVV